MAGIAGADFQAESFVQGVEGMERVRRRLYNGRS